VDAPGALAGGGTLQAAADGDAVAYGSVASFGGGGQGAPPASQYVSRRGGDSWATENITTPALAGSYGLYPDGVPYQLFSPDLARGLMLNGRHCRGVGEDCAVANPPLPGTDAPAGYQNYYLRDSAGGGFEALLGSFDVAGLALEPARFELAFAGASPDLRHVALSTCAALTADAVEVPLGAGCDPGSPNLYAWSGGALRLVNLLPGQAQGSPGAALGAQSRAISADGASVYWSDGASLYLRAGGETKQVDTEAGGGGVFETAAVDGSVAFFTRDGHLHRYETASETSTDLTPSGGAQGVLGASDDGSRVYYLTADGLFLRQGGTTTKVAAAAGPGNYPPTTGTARVTADGGHLAFLSTASPTGYDNTDRFSGEPHSQVFLYDAEADLLSCVSCRPSGARPDGPSTIPAAAANGVGPEATRSYKPRALSADGRRLFFDSEDSLLAVDSNGDSDVYQWQAQGSGSCARGGGCIDLISSGRAAGGASFVDASSDGADVFFLTDASLVAGDPGSVDLYDARVGGGFPDPPEPTPCEGNACQPLLSEPVDPHLNTLLRGLGNQAVHYPGTRRRCGKGRVKRQGKCVRRAQGRKHHGRGGRR
jgi:hypothetical protein